MDKILPLSLCGNLLFRRSRWFTRGWTLQELIAPASVSFFSREGTHLGDKKSLERQLCEATGVPANALRRGPLSRFSVDERISWAENRDTRRKEDKAYSLMGLFDIHMPLLYGERERKAFKRLRDEIHKTAKGECHYLVHLRIALVVFAAVGGKPSRRSIIIEDVNIYQIPRYPPLELCQQSRTRRR